MFSSALSATYAAKIILVFRALFAFRKMPGAMNVAPASEPLVSRISGTSSPYRDDQVIALRIS